MDTVWWVIGSMDRPYPLCKPQDVYQAASLVFGHSNWSEVSCNLEWFEWFKGQDGRERTCLRILQFCLFHRRNPTQNEIQVLLPSSKVITSYGTITTFFRCSNSSCDFFNFSPSTWIRFSQIWSLLQTNMSCSCYSPANFGKIIPT